MKIIEFENDKEFEDYVVDKNIITYPKGYYDWEFTDMYLDDIDNGVMFCINDANSKVNKRKSVTYKLITKNVSNLIDPNLLEFYKAKE